MTAMKTRSLKKLTSLSHPDVSATPNLAFFPKLGCTVQTTNDYLVSLPKSHRNPPRLSFTTRYSPFALLFVGVLPLLAQTPVWTHTYCGPGGAGEAAEAACRDTAGNVYLAGGDEERMIVVAVSPDGTEHWHYDYAAHGAYNYAFAVTCDLAGNVYACGSIGVGEEQEDFGVISLTRDGEFRWDYHCNGIGGENASATAVEVGPDGTIFVCGTTESSTTGQDITVVALSPTGAERWRFDYDAGFGDFDRALDLTVGPDSNIYVCGTSRGSDTTFLDLTVLSLTPAGLLRWVSRYISPGYDVAEAIGCGPDRRIYVAGSSRPNNSDDAFCVACFGLEGSCKWVFEKQPYTGANQGRDIVCGNDRVYVCGRLATPDSSEDLAVVSVDTSGHELWTWTYDGPDHCSDIAYRLTIDPAGGVAVCGASSSGEFIFSDMVCAELTPAGTQRWLYRSSGPVRGWNAGLAVLPGPDRSIYCAGGMTDSLTGNDFALVRLDETGSPAWVYTYDSGTQPGADRAWCAAVAPDGSSCIAGSADWGAGYQDFALVGLDPAGTQRWQYHLNGPGGFGDIAWSVVYGPDGNWYAAGRTSNTNNGELFTIVSVDNTGHERWVWSHGPARTYNTANWLATDGTRIYACGGTNDSTSGFSFTVASLTPLGTLDWLYRLPNRQYGMGFAFAVAPGPAGSIWATGRWQTPSHDHCMTTVKLTPQGNLAGIWTLDPPHMNYGIGLYIAQGPDGNVYACGYDEDSLADWFTVASFTPGCSLRWLYTAPEPGIATGLAFGPDSAVYVCGTLFDTASSQIWDMAVVTLEPGTGTRRWVKRFDSGMWDIANSVAVGQDSCIYVAGVLVSPDFKEDFALACVAPDGSERWLWTARGAGDQGNSATWVTPGPNRTILVTGGINNAETNGDMFAALFGSLTGIAVSKPAPGPRLLVPSHFRTALPIRLPRLTGPATLSVLDVAGRILHEQPVSGIHPHVTLNLAHLPVGSYVLRLNTGGRVLTARTLKLD